MDLNPNGGLVSEALRIGRHAWKNGLFMTIENAHYYSSCALIWFAGLKRAVSYDRKLGVHRSYLKNNSK